MSKRLAIALIAAAFGSPAAAQDSFGPIASPTTARVTASFSEPKIDKFEIDRIWRFDVDGEAWGEVQASVRLSGDHTTELWITCRFLDRNGVEVGQGSAKVGDVPDRDGTKPAHVRAGTSKPIVVPPGGFIPADLHVFFVPSALDAPFHTVDCEAKAL